MKTRSTQIIILVVAALAHRTFGAVQFFTNESQFVSAAGILTNVNFDDHPTGTNISGMEWSEAGVIFLTNRGPLRVYSEPDPNITANTPPNVLLPLTGSGDEWIQMVFPGKPLAMGFWLIDSELQSVEGDRVVFFDYQGAPLHTSLMPVLGSLTGSAAANYFLGLVSDVPIGGVDIQEFQTNDGNERVGIDTLLIGRPALDTRLEIRVSQVELCWSTVTNLLYQLEYREAFGTNGWLPFGSAVPGTGARFCTNDVILPGQPRRFYQLSITNAP